MKGLFTQVGINWVTSYCSSRITGVPYDTIFPTTQPVLQYWLHSASPQHKMLCQLLKWSKVERHFYLEVKVKFRCYELQILKWSWLACACWVTTVVSYSLWRHGLQTSRPPCTRNSPGKNTGVGCHSLLQGIFLTQGIEPGSPALQADSLPSKPPGKSSWLVYFLLFPLFEPECHVTWHVAARQIS